MLNIEIPVENIPLYKEVPLKPQFSYFSVCYAAFISHFQHN